MPTLIRQEQQIISVFPRARLLVRQEELVLFLIDVPSFWKGNAIEC